MKFFGPALAAIVFSAITTHGAQFTLSVQDGGSGLFTVINQPSTLREDNSYASADGNGLGFLHVVSNTLDDPFRDRIDPSFPTIGGVYGQIRGDFFPKNPSGGFQDVTVTAPYYLQTSSHANATIELQILSGTNSLFYERVFVGAPAGVGGAHGETKTGVITANLTGLRVNVAYKFQLTASGATYEGGGRSQSWTDPTFTSTTPGGSVQIDSGLLLVNSDFIPLPEPAAPALAFLAALAFGLRRRRA